MAELWRELIEKDSPEIAGGLSLLRVSISRKTGQMLVQLASERILSRSELKRLQRTMEGAFPAVGLKLEVKYPALKEAVSADIGRAAKLLKELLSHKCPGAVHFKQLAGDNTHHSLEACFKGMGRALRQEVALEPGFEDEIPSTKGNLI